MSDANTEAAAAAAATGAAKAAAAPAAAAPPVAAAATKAPAAAKAPKAAEAAEGAYSLRRRLIAAILGASVLLWIVSVAVVVHVAWRETSDVYDDALKEGARLTLVLATSLQTQQALAGRDAAALGEPAKLKLYYQIVAADGRLLRRAEGAPDQPFSKAWQRDQGHLNAWADGRAWRVYVLRAEGRGFQVQIGQPWEERLELLEEMAEDLAWPALALLLLLGGFCWFAIRRLLRPLEHTAGLIATKSPNDLAPVPSAGEPRELQPIVQAFNLVLARLAQALQAERRFTADAAHELRTPLAALRMRLQLMQRQQSAASAASPPDLASLRDDVDRCTALVDNLLALARMDPERPEALAKEAVDLSALLARLDTGQAAARNITLTTVCTVDRLLAHPALLESALRNLIDNALRYCPAGSRVEVLASPIARGVRIAVRDDGPGVSAADQARLAERFFRVLGTGQTGSGLGLSIVSRIVVLHGASLRFEPGLDQRGLGVVMDFPA